MNTDATLHHMIPHLNNLMESKVFTFSWAIRTPRTFSSIV